MATIQGPGTSSLRAGTEHLQDHLKEDGRVFEKAGLATSLLKKTADAEGIVKAKSIAEARVAFKGLSAKAIAMAKGRSGFFVAHCPMVKGGGADWVQTTRKISNPYFGSQMLNCGSIKN